MRFLSSRAFLGAAIGGVVMGVVVACTSGDGSGADSCPATRNGCSVRCLPTNPRSLSAIEAAYAGASPNADCPTGAIYAERREACGRIEYFEYGGPPGGSYYDPKTGALLGIDYSAEGSCTYAGQIGFGCADSVKCTFLCGTGKGRLLSPLCEPPRDGGVDGSDGAADGSDQ